jgi:hypothetical protein
MREARDAYVRGSMAKEAIYWCREAGQERKGASEYTVCDGYDYYLLL